MSRKKRASKKAAKNAELIIIAIILIKYPHKKSQKIHVKTAKNDPKKSRK